MGNLKSFVFTRTQILESTHSRKLRKKPLRQRRSLVVFLSLRSATVTTPDWHRLRHVEPILRLEPRWGRHVQRRIHQRRDPKMPKGSRIRKAEYGYATCSKDLPHKEIGWSVMLCQQKNNCCFIGSIFFFAHLKQWWSLHQRDLGCHSPRNR